ncbi:hypothetical protein B1218_35850, partial [Pseudomonas ogarae]
ETLLKHAQAMDNAALPAQAHIPQSRAPLGKLLLGVTARLGITFVPSLLDGPLPRAPGLAVEPAPPPPIVFTLPPSLPPRTHPLRPHP